MTATGTSKSNELVLRITPLGFPWETSDPFIFCAHHDDHYPAGNDRLGPAASLAGRNLGKDFEQGRLAHVPRRGRAGLPAPPAPRLRDGDRRADGCIDHSDSLGATARYGGGDVQWLTAGRGIQHAEMFPLLEPARPNPLELFQLWLNLPAANKMVEPHFSMMWNESIPRRAVRDERGRAAEVTVIAGALQACVRRRRRRTRWRRAPTATSRSGPSSWSRARVGPPRGQPPAATGRCTSFAAARCTSTGRPSRRSVGVGCAPSGR